MVQQNNLLITLKKSDFFLERINILYIINLNFLFIVFKINKYNNFK